MTKANELLHIMIWRDKNVQKQVNMTRWKNKKFFNSSSVPFIYEITKVRQRDIPEIAETAETVAEIAESA